MDKLESSGRESEVKSDEGASEHEDGTESRAVSRISVRRVLRSGPLTAKRVGVGGGGGMARYPVDGPFVNIIWHTIHI